MIAINDTWFEGSHPGNQMTGMIINTQINSTTAVTGPSVGLYVTGNRHAGTLGVYGSNISATDWTGDVNIGALIGMELGLAGNGKYFTNRAGNLDLVLNSSVAPTSGGPAFQAGFAVRATNFGGDMTRGGYDHPFYFHHTNAYIAAFGGSGNIATGASGFDASLMTYDDTPGIAFRVGGENAIDFGNAGKLLLQFTAVGAPRLRFVINDVEVLSLTEDGHLRFVVPFVNALNDAGAAAQAVPVGGFYANGSAVQIRIS